MYKKIKSTLGKLNFFIGRSPEIEKRIDWKRFIPEPYKAVLLISADFELAWAWRYTKSSQDPIKKALTKARLERENIPNILLLCEQYNIPVTWATVGHLFLESCNRCEGLAHPELPRLDHFDNDFWRFQGVDWFEFDPCTDYKTNPEWYCPGLIRMILDSPIKHEIGCHTFSHIDCSDEICKPALMTAELKECKNIASKWGLNITSFVHPGYTIGNLDTLSREGFTNFRTDYRNVLGYPMKHDNGLWEFEQTTEFVYNKKWSFDYHIYKYKEIIKRAIKSNTLCVLWFHPSFDSVVVEKILPEVFDFINKNRDQIWLVTHGEYVGWLDNKEGVD